MWAMKNTPISFLGFFDRSSSYRRKPNNKDMFNWSPPNSRNYVMILPLNEKVCGCALVTWLETYILNLPPANWNLVYSL